MGKTRVNLIKLFWHNFTHTFCKRDHFINVTIIFLYCEKFSAQESVNKFTQKCSMWLIAESYPMVEHLKMCFTRVGSSITPKQYTMLVGLARDKHSDLLQTFVYYCGKKFLNVGRCGQSCKTFYVRNLQIFILS